MLSKTGAACCVLVAAILVALVFQCLPIFHRLRRLQSVLVLPHEKDANALRIGLLGASFIGRSAVVHAADKRRDVIVVAVAARDEARAKAFAGRFGIASAYGGKDAYRDLLRHPGLDAVYVGLPTRLHYAWVVEVLAAGKHVLVEKPVTANAADVEALEAKAARSGLVLFEGAHYRYHPAARRMRELMKEKAAGRLTRLESRFSMLDPKAWAFSMLQSPPDRTSDARLQERVKNLDRWWYCVDSLLWSSSATSAEVISATEERYSLSVKLALTVPDTESGGSAVVNASVDMARDRLLQPFDWSLGASGQEGQLHLANLGFPFLWHSLSAELASGSRREQHYGAGETTFEHQLGAFVAAVREGKAPEGASGALTMRLVDEIFRAAGSAPIPSQPLA